MLDASNGCREELEGARALSIRTKDEILGKRRKCAQTTVIDSAQDSDIAVGLIVPTDLHVDLVPGSTLPGCFELSRLANFARQFGIRSPPPLFEVSQ